MYSFIELSIFLMFYAIIGWSVEVIYATVNKGIFVNRGFLNGPVCPIYGIGATVVIICLTPIQDSLPILYIGSFFLTSFIEYFTGLVLELIFNQKWWDYSKEPFNLRGYVCLKFSLMWGLACVFVMRVIQPIVLGAINHLPHNIWVILVIIFYTTIFLDIVVTVIALAKIHMRIRVVNDIDNLLTFVSDKLGEKISESTLEGMDSFHKRKKKLDEAYIKLEEKTKAKYGENYKDKMKPGIIHRRLEKAFPSLDYSRFFNMKERLEEMKKALEELSGNDSEK